MDIGQLGGKLLDAIKKYRYPILILLVGIALMLLPERKQQPQVSTQPEQTMQEQTDVVLQLEQILSQIKGVGKVQVMLKESEGERYLYQSNEDITAGDSSSSSRKDTVIITDSDRNQQPVIYQILPPKYQGAIVVCQGAQDPAVKLAVVEAVASITGLGADVICVLKMK